MCKRFMWVDRILWLVSCLLHQHCDTECRQEGRNRCKNRKDCAVGTSAYSQMDKNWLIIHFCLSQSDTIAWCRSRGRKLKKMKRDVNLVIPWQMRQLTLVRPNSLIVIYTFSCILLLHQVTAHIDEIYLLNKLVNECLILVLKCQYESFHDTWFCFFFLKTISGIISTCRG